MPRYQSRKARRELMTPEEAREYLERARIRPGTNFFALSFDQKTILGGFAGERKYQKPWKANGSAARYFYRYIQRTLDRATA